MKKLFLIIALCLPFMVQAQSGKIDFVEYDLDNGLHVILQQDNTTPNIVISIMYHVGSKNESPNLTGFAHFFEHLMFEGTKHIKRHEYDKYVMNAGGSLNANTFYDRTYYYELLPSNELALGLWLESERMLHPTLEAVGIKTQKDVVCQEMGQSRDNRPYGRLMSETFKRAFTVHPYHHDVLGKDEHIRNASDQDFIDFHNKFYVPNNAVLTIVGDFKIDEAKKLVHDYFNDIPRGADVVQPPMNEPIKTAEVRDTTYDNIQLPAIVLAYPSPQMNSDDYYTVSMLNQLLSQGKSSRLLSTIVEDKQLALQLASFPLPIEHPGISMIFALPNMGVDMNTLQSAIEEEITKVQQAPISDKEFQKLKNQMENDLVSSNATIEHRAENLATAYTYYKNTNQVNEELSKYMAVTKEDLQKAAQKYFDKNKRVVLLYMPQKN